MRSHFENGWQCLMDRHGGADEVKSAKRRLNPNDSAGYVEQQDNESDDYDGDEEDGELGFLCVYNHEFRDLSDYQELLDVDEVIKHDRNLVRRMSDSDDPFAAFLMYVAEAAGLPSSTEDAVLDFFSDPIEPLSLYSFWTKAWLPRSLRFMKLVRLPMRHAMPDCLEVIIPNASHLLLFCPLAL